MTHKSKYDVDALRKKLTEQGSRKSDPDEFRPDKPKDVSTEIKYRFYILPPVCQNDKVKGGALAAKGMELYAIPNGAHWVNQKPHACPRVINNEDCIMCNMGFDLFKLHESKEKRTKIRQQWMPNEQWLVNIFFTGWKSNPETLRGKVMWYALPKTVYDLCSATIHRQDGGDEEDPQAFGVFFDEFNAFPLELVVHLNGGQVSYQKTRFLPTAQPIVKKADSTEPDEELIQKVLDNRHYLYGKVDEPNLARLKQVYDTLVDGDDDQSGDAGFTSDESKNEKKEEKPKEEKPKAEDKPKLESRGTASAKNPNKSDKLKNNERVTSGDDDDVASLLSQGETPVKSEKSEKPNTAAASKPSTAESEDEDSTDLANIMAQLSGDDD
jgi:hypothetical protein